MGPNADFLSMYATVVLSMTAGSGILFEVLSDCSFHNYNSKFEALKS